MIMTREKKENHDPTLDLSRDAHIQTTENFSKGKIATHNTKIDYQQRYNDWKNNFQKDENGNFRKKSEIICDPTANSHLTEEERIALGDSIIDEWLNSEKDGKKPAKRFDIDEDEIRKLDEEARSGKEVLKKGERKPYDENNMDIIISTAEIIRDPAASAHLTKAK